MRAGANGEQLARACVAAARPMTTPAPPRARASPASLLAQVRMLGYAALTAAPSPNFVLLVEPLHGVTFALYYTASVSYMAKVRRAYDRGAASYCSIVMLLRRTRCLLRAAQSRPRSALVLCRLRPIDSRPSSKRARSRRLYRASIGIACSLGRWHSRPAPSAPSQPAAESGTPRRGPGSARAVCCGVAKL